MVQGQRVKGQGHSVSNRQRRLTEKSVRICCLFKDEKGRGATWSAFMVARRYFPKRYIFEQKNPQKMLIICRSTGAKSGWLSSCNAFAIARILVNTNLHRTLHRFRGLLQIIGQICALDRGVHVFNALVRDEPLKSWPRNLDGVDISTEDNFVLSQGCVWRTEGQTNRKVTEIARPNAVRCALKSPRNIRACNSWETHLTSRSKPCDVVKQHVA